jgi:hypothetical protein
MRTPSLLACCSLLSLAGLAWMPAASAESPFNMMNPSKWFNSRDNDDRYRDRYYDRYDRYGYGGGPWGYGGGPYGGGPWGYGGGPWGGYGPYGGGPWGYGGGPWSNNNSNNTPPPPPPRLPE